MAENEYVEAVLGDLFDAGAEPRVRVAGVGGAGGNVVSALSERELQGMETVVVNADRSGLERARADRKVHLAPPDFVRETDRLEADWSRELERRDALKLISKRERASLNSWLRNAPGYVKERSNHLHIHPEDAARAGLADGDTAEIASAFGKVEAPVRVTDSVMPRTVALPHGWGHAAARGLALAREHAGVNSNLLAGDGALNTEALSGMSHLSGIEVSVRRVERGTPEAGGGSDALVRRGAT